MRLQKNSFVAMSPAGVLAGFAGTSVVQAENADMTYKAELSPLNSKTTGSDARGNGATASARQLRFSILSFTTMYCISAAATGIINPPEDVRIASNNAGITGRIRLWDADVTLP